MSNTLSKIFIFAVGAATGSAATWYFLKTKYERIAQEEIDSVKAEFSRKDTDIFETECKKPDEPTIDVVEIHETENGAEIAVPKTNLDIREYTSALKKCDYVDYANTNTPVIRKEKEANEMEDRYVISPDDFDEAGFDIITLIYYPDGTLVDSDGNNLGDAKDYLDIDPEEHFGEYEDDSVFIRDCENEIDYEILRVEE